MGLSVNFDAVRARIRRLPRYAEECADMSTRRDALYMIQAFQQGLAENRWPLTPLRQRTVKRKQKKGYAAPESPLYGLGMEDTRTIASSIRAYKIRNGYRVKLPNTPHHESGLTVAQLWAVHENGAVIKNGRGVTVIPARPVFALAYADTLRHRQERDTVREVQDACTQMLLGVAESVRERISDMDPKLEQYIVGGR